MTKRRKRGRPTRAKRIDPMAVLEGIASNRRAPAAVRIAACRALLLATRRIAEPAAPDTDDVDVTSKRALIILGA